MAAAPSTQTTTSQSDGTKKGKKKSVSKKPKASGPSGSSGAAAAQPRKKKKKVSSSSSSTKPRAKTATKKKKASAPTKEAEAAPKPRKKRVTTRQRRQAPAYPGYGPPAPAPMYYPQAPPPYYEPYPYSMYQQPPPQPVPYGQPPPPPPPASAGDDDDDSKKKKDDDDDAASDDDDSKAGEKQKKKDAKDKHKWRNRFLFVTVFILIGVVITTAISKNTSGGVGALTDCGSVRNETGCAKAINCSWFNGTCLDLECPLFSSDREFCEDKTRGQCMFSSGTCKNRNCSAVTKEGTCNDTKACNWNAGRQACEDVGPEEEGGSIVLNIIAVVTMILAGITMVAMSGVLGTVTFEGPGGSKARAGATAATAEGE